MKLKFKLNNLIAIVPTFFALFYKLQNILGVQVAYLNSFLSSLSFNLDIIFIDIEGFRLILSNF